MFGGGGAHSAALRSGAISGELDTPTRGSPAPSSQGSAGGESGASGGRSAAKITGHAAFCYAWTHCIHAWQRKSGFSVSVAQVPTASVVVSALISPVVVNALMYSPCRKKSGPGDLAVWNRMNPRPDEENFRTWCDSSCCLLPDVGACVLLIDVSQG